MLFFLKLEVNQYFGGLNFSKFFYYFFVEKDKNNWTINDCYLILVLFLLFTMEIIVKKTEKNFWFCRDSNSHVLSFPIGINKVLDDLNF